MYRRGYFTSREYLAKKAKVTKKILEVAERAKQLNNIKVVHND